jgi:hypothetical protein
MNMKESKRMKKIAANDIPYKESNFQFSNRLWNDTYKLNQMINTLYKNIKTHRAEQTEISNLYNPKLSKLKNKKSIEKVINKLSKRTRYNSKSIPKTRGITKTYDAIMIDDDNIMETDTCGHSPQFKNNKSIVTIEPDIEYVGTTQHTPKSMLFSTILLHKLVVNLPSLFGEFQRF